ncbi:carboxypeptidase-like protein [Mucilaginibacter yixingensis]|uniref:Carboxypeptidase-like protein n=1 Tax=Mucilaginibacter yixingensis TaxID=1295612 RepID=A0A2T5JA99_9SPHI|nr:carboxypeptidase-like regulatory domain-containing protein [Mucilaginibacter yixingensis]PTQ96978.1 carboxypeptidase-like protein [Mucilaginibacter yixingensis]
MMTNKNTPNWPSLQWVKCLLFLLFFPSLLFAQNSISGKVVRIDSKGPLSKVSIFLGNSSYGTITNDDGTFTLNNVKPGQYELIATMVGFEDNIQTVLVSKDPVKLNIEMFPKITELHEVVVTDNANWKANYAMFKPEFLGTSDNAKKCTILNPHDISLVYKKSKRTLQAFSSEFIVIQNKALGYNVKMLLKDFKYDEVNNVISWQGKLLFEELKGSASQQAVWDKRRQEIYYGSPMHFFRSLRLGNLTDQGFQVMILVRRPDPERPPQDVIVREYEHFKNSFLKDSINYWARMYNRTKYINQLIRTPVKETQIMTDTSQPGIYGLEFPECLYVMYTKKREDVDFKDVYRPLDLPNYETSVVTLNGKYALFDMNGSVISSPSPLFEGTWSKDKVAELLPVDYLPPGAH